MSRSSRIKVHDTRWSLDYELQPSVHPVEPDKFLIPLMRRKYGDYRLYISRSIARFYTEETLPEFVRAQLAMICVVEPKEPLKTDDAVHAKGLYKHLYNAATPDLGWRLSPSYFIIVATREQLDILDSPCTELDNV